MDRQRSLGLKSTDFDDGQLDNEIAYTGGVRHGYEYLFYQNGQLLSKENYRHGKVHGTGKQWSEDGQLLVTWKFSNGAGLDLWCQPDGTLLEEVYCAKGDELGYKRQWNGGEKTICEEYYFLFTGYHGIWRKWNVKGTLRRGCHDWHELSHG